MTKKIVIEWHEKNEMPTGEARKQILIQFDDGEYAVTEPWALEVSLMERGRTFDQIKMWAYLPEEGEE